MKNLIGKRLDDRYEFVELIGVGGMANVYKAYDSLKGCHVAIKVLKEKFLGNKEFVYRFRNESKANASLSHPNIVRIFDVGFGNKMQYIVMEYIEGVTLKEFINKAHILNWKDVVHFTFQILRGLQHAHDKGIVHRDIKPQNIMLLEDGTIKIMDFGIARFPRDEKIDFKKTVGSVHYISPEQAIGGITDFKSDIYSVGIMMYEMLTGQLPFDGKTPEIVAQKQIKEIVRSPLEINPNLPQGLVDIILRAIKKKPQDRYQSAEEMLRDIDEFKQNPNVSFGYRYLDDIETTKYFGLPEDIRIKSDLLRGYKQPKIKRKKKEKLVPILIGVAAGFFLLAIVMVITFMFRRGRNDLFDIEIPNFVGHNIEEVKIMDNGKYKDLGYTIIRKPDSKVPADVIIDQSLKSGTVVKSNYNNLTFTVSSGAEIRKIPMIVGLKLSEAEEKLKKAGFVNIEKIEKIDESKAPGAVISVEPKYKDEVAFDTNVKVVYNGNFVRDKEENNILAVPKVIGKPLEEAKKAIEDAGFKVKVKEVHESNKPADVVISQSANTAILGSSIELGYNLGADKQQNEGDEKKKINIQDLLENQFKNKFSNQQEEEGTIRIPKELNKNYHPVNTHEKVTIPITASVKTDDVYDIYVVDGFGKIYGKKTGYRTDQNCNMDVSLPSHKSGVYSVIIESKKTKNRADYGKIKVTAGDGSSKFSSNYMPGKFAQITSQDQDIELAD